MKAWFGPKQTGYGISPCRWQGWVSVLGYGVGCWLIATRLPQDFDGFHDAKFIGIMILTGLILAIAFLTYSKTPETDGTTLADRYLLGRK
jgi:hypothetical protein